MKSRVLIVDDEPQALDMMEELFRNHGFDTLRAEDGHEALQVIRSHTPDIMVSDIMMPNLNGMELLKIVGKQYPEIAVIMVTAQGTVEAAVDAMKMGAKDYILKPIRLDEMIAKVKNLTRMKYLEVENQDLKRQLHTRYGFTNIIGNTQTMMDLFDVVKTVAQTTSTVLIRGENGTGKELIANAIHYNSDRANRSFVKVNCGVLAENLLESELFGHVKGAFTGAIKDKAGRFEMANGGSIFLDEIGDVTPNMQVKLLRVLEEKEFERVGSNETFKSDVRIIAATNQDLEEGLEKKTCRKDLYFRLNVIPIVVPPLRDRKDDIPLLIQHFIEKYNKEFNKHINGVEREAVVALSHYDWPGNIRELENLIERAIVLSKSETLSLVDFPQEIAQYDLSSKIDINPDDKLADMVDEFEKIIIVKALEENKNNKLRTAEKLGIHRSTFMSKLKKYEIG